MRTVPITVPKIVPVPPKEARAADHHGRDHGQLIACSGDSLGRIEARRQHERAEPGEESHDHIDAGGDRPHVEAGQARSLRIAADRIDLAPVARVAQHDMGEHGAGQEDDHRNRNLPEQAPLAPPDEAGIESADGAAAREKQRAFIRRRSTAQRICRKRSRSLANHCSNGASLRIPSSARRSASTSAPSRVQRTHSVSVTRGDPAPTALNAARSSDNA